MDYKEVQGLLRRAGIRVGPEVAGYVQRRLMAAGTQGIIPVIGGDARTGVPVRKEFSVGQLQELAPGVPDGNAGLAQRQARQGDA